MVRAVGIPRLREAFTLGFLAYLAVPAVSYSIVQDMSRVMGATMTFLYYVGQELGHEFVAVELGTGAGEVIAHFGRSVIVPMLPGDSPRPTVGDLPGLPSTPFDVEVVETADSQAWFVTGGERHKPRFAQVRPSSAIYRTIPASAARPKGAAAAARTFVTGSGFGLQTPRPFHEPEKFSVLARTEGGQPATSGTDTFFTEVYKKDGEGSLQWESDAGVSTYGPLVRDAQCGTNFTETPRSMPTDVYGLTDSGDLHDASSTAPITQEVAFKQRDEPGLYSGCYRVRSAGHYQVAISQLQQGGIEAAIWDNRWLDGTPCSRRVEPEVSFNWGFDPVAGTATGYASTKWQGKLLSPATEEFSISVRVIGGVRLYLDHQLVIDAWKGNLRAAKERVASVDLVKGKFHDLLIEYTDEGGGAGIQVMWSSESTPPSVIPASALHYSTPIAGSPYSVSVRPSGAAPEYTEVHGDGLSQVTSYKWSEFVIVAKDSRGQVIPQDLTVHGVSPFEVDITADGLSFPDCVVGPTYIGAGLYSVHFMSREPGMYQVSVRTADGNHVRCGLSQDQACSPFEVLVSPGPTVAHSSVVEVFTPADIDGVVQGIVGEKKTLKLQAKDAYGYNRLQGGDTVSVYLVPSFPSNYSSFSPGRDAMVKGFQGAACDNEDGTYTLSYVLESAGTYSLRVTLGGKRVRYCGRTYDSEEGTLVEDAMLRTSTCSFSSPSVNIADNDPRILRSYPLVDEGEGEPIRLGHSAMFSLGSTDAFRDMRSLPPLRIPSSPSKFQVALTSSFLRNIVNKNEQQLSMDSHQGVSWTTSALPPETSESVCSVHPDQCALTTLSGEDGGGGNVFLGVYLKDPVHEAYQRRDEKSLTIWRPLKVDTERRPFSGIQEPSQLLLRPVPEWWRTRRYHDIGCMGCHARRYVYLSGQFFTEYFSGGGSRPHIRAVEEEENPAMACCNEALLATIPSAVGLSGYHACDTRHGSSTAAISDSARSEQLYRPVYVMGYRPTIVDKHRQQPTDYSTQHDEPVETQPTDEVSWAFAAAQVLLVWELWILGLAGMTSRRTQRRLRLWLENLSVNIARGLLPLSVAAMVIFVGPRVVAGIAWAFLKVHTVSSDSYEIARLVSGWLLSKLTGGLGQILPSSKEAWQLAWASDLASRFRYATTGNTGSWLAALVVASLLDAAVYIRRLWQARNTPSADCTADKNGMATSSLQTGGKDDKGADGDIQSKERQSKGHDEKGTGGNVQGQKRRSKKGSWLPKAFIRHAGLTNPGNDCPLNAVLQLLRSTFSAGKDTTRDGNDGDAPSSSTGTFMDQLLHLYKDMSSGQSSAYEVSKDLKAQIFSSLNLPPNVQADATEVLLKLFDILESEGYTANSPLELFRGMHGAVCRCSCSNETRRSDAFTLLTVAMQPLRRGKKRPKSVALTALLAKMFSREKVDTCEECRHLHGGKSVPSERERSVFLDKCPENLLMMLGRFTGDGGVPRKKLTHLVRIPVVLDVAPYMECGQASGGAITYDLNAVVHHTAWPGQEGDVESHEGHYFTFVRTGQDKWCKLDDTRATTVSTDEVLTNGAYLLSYTKRAG